MGELTVDCERAFKQNIVTNAFNGTEDYVVFDKIFRLFDDDMQILQGNLLGKPPPKTLRAVVRNLISTKGIVRKNAEGSELLDYMDDHIETTTNENTDTDSESSDEDEKIAEVLEENAPACFPVETPDDVALTSFVPLSGRCFDQDINSEALFLDEL